MEATFDAIDRFMRSLPYFDRFMVWAWGPYDYPRWLRRTYILLWPLLMPLRWIGLGAIMLAGIFIALVAGFVIGMLIELAAALRGFASYIHQQWTI